MQGVSTSPDAKQAIKQKYDAIYQRGFRDGQASLQKDCDYWRDSFNRELQLRLEWQQHVPESIVFKRFPGPWMAGGGS